MKKYSAKDTFEKRKIMNMSLEQYTQYRADQRERKRLSDERRAEADEQKKAFMTEYHNPEKIRLLSLCSPWCGHGKFRLYMTFEAWELIFPLTNADSFEKNRIRAAATFIEGNRWISSYPVAQNTVNAYWIRISTKD